MIGKSGDNENYNMSGGMNLLSGRALTEVPLGGKGSWLVSARRSYTDLVRTGLYNSIFNTLEGAEEDTPTPAGPGLVAVVAVAEAEDSALSSNSLSSPTSSSTM